MIPRPMPRVNRRKLLELGAEGLTWRALGDACGVSANTARRQWFAYASAALQDARGAAIASARYRGRAEDLARLIARGREGDTWRLVGAEFYPEQPDPNLAAFAAYNMFSRHATPADKKARRLAMKAHNSNRTPGLSRTAARRRDKRGIREWKAIPEFARPWAGMGECFA